MKTIFVGPFPPPINGQSVCLKFLVDNLSSNKSEYVTYDTSKFENRTLNAVFCFFQLTYFILKNKNIGLIYLSGSRTLLGIIKELPIYLLKPFKKYNLMFHCHGYEYSNYIGIKKIFFSYLFTFFDAIIVLSDAMKKSFNNLKANIFVVENFYHSDFEKEINLKAKKNIIIFYSNIIKSKGIFEFLHFSESFLKENHDWQIKIAGAFVGDKYLSKPKIIKSFKLNYNILKKKYGERIEYLGILKNNERVKLLEDSKFYVLPTYYETEAIPLSIIEAMRTGNIIISTYHNLLPSFLNEKNGALIYPKSPEQILNSIRSFIKTENKMRNIMIYNINTAKINFSPENHLKKMKKILKFPNRCQI